MSTSVIKFSCNWNNKLNNKAFSTIRLHNPSKYAIGQSYAIRLNSEQKGIATLKSKRVLKLEQLNEFICYLDTGYNKTQTVSMLQKMYQNINLQTALFDFCLLVYEQQPAVTKPMQSILQFDE